MTMPEKLIKLISLLKQNKVFHWAQSESRIYNAQADSFSWGSWILKDGAPQSAAIESALMVYSYAIEHLGFRAAHFDVRKGNENVWRFHERFGAERVGETEDDYLYQIDIEKILVARLKYKRYLPEIVNIEW